MPHLSFGELISRRVPLSAAEAAALTLAVARVMDAERAAGRRVTLPDDDWIILSNNGEVSLVDIHSSSQQDETANLSALLRRLLRLDEAPQEGQRKQIPGGLLIVVARNLGYIHLPATSPNGFRAALERFATSDPAVLARVFWRAAGARPELLHARPALVPRSTHQRRQERRQHGLSSAELRRSLRELERELFELRRDRRQIGHRAPARGVAGRWMPVASVLTIVAAVLLVLAASGVGSVHKPATASVTSTEAVGGASSGVAVSAANVAQKAGTISRRANDRRPARRAVPARTRLAASPNPSSRTRTPVRSDPSAAVSPASSKRAAPVAAFPGGTRSIPFPTGSE